MKGLNLEQAKKIVKFDAVRDVVARQHDLKNPDVVIEMDKIRLTKQLDVEIPNAGTFRMTDWAKKQIGSILGVQWDKWFDPRFVTHTQVQEELQRRFSRTGDQRKLRTKRFKDGSPGIPGCDGYLRAVLGPVYHPIDDERVFDRLEKQFGSESSELQFMPNHLSKKNSWGNDHCNYYTMVGQPVNMGAINREHPDPEVRRTYDIAEMEGALPEDDLVYPGFNMRNSEVGYTAITIDEFSFRLVCLNGMMITTGDSRLLYRRHVPIEDAHLDKQLKDVFDKAPVRWETTRQQMALVQGVLLNSPTQVIEDELKRLGAPKYFRELAVKKHEEEPLKNGYGVLQAITRAAQDYDDDMDKRFEFEAMSGRVLQRMAAMA
jgi:hypothetical protein